MHKRQELEDELDFARAERSDAYAEYARAAIRVYDADRWVSKIERKIEDGTTL